MHPSLMVLPKWFPPAIKGALVSLMTLSCQSEQEMRCKYVCVCLVKMMFKLFENNKGLFVQKLFVLFIN